MSEDLIRLFKEIPVFSNLTDRQIKALIDLGEVRTFKKDEYLFREGDPMNDMLVVLDGEVDVATLRAIVEAAPKLKVTFHRAFDELLDPQGTIRILKTIPQIDRILTIGGAGSLAALAFL